MRSLIFFANKGYLGWAASLAFASSCLLFGCFADPLGKCGIEKWLGGFKGESPQRSRRRAMSASSSVCSRPVRSRQLAARFSVSFSGVLGRSSSLA